MTLREGPGLDRSLASSVWLPFPFEFPCASLQKREPISAHGGGWKLGRAWAVAALLVVELLLWCLSCRHLNPPPTSPATASPGSLLGAIASRLCFPSLPENFTLLSRVRNKPYDVFGCWLNETNLISGNLHRIGRITSCSVLWLNNAFQVRGLCSSSTGQAASCCSWGRKSHGGGVRGKNGPTLLSSLFVSSDLPSGPRA